MADSNPLHSVSTSCPGGECWGSCSLWASDRLTLRASSLLLGSCQAALLYQTLQVAHVRRAHNNYECYEHYVGQPYSYTLKALEGVGSVAGHLIFATLPGTEDAGLLDQATGTPTRCSRLLPGAGLSARICRGSKGVGTLEGTSGTGLGF